MQNTSLVSHARNVGLVFIILYVVCLLWRLVITDPVATELHMTSLKVAFPGFQGYTPMSLLWGAVLSFVYGFLGSLLFHSMHKNCCGVK